MIHPLSRLVRLSRWLGLAALLLGAGAIVVALTGEAERARRGIVVALALGGAGLIGLALAFTMQRRRRAPQDRP